MSELRDRLERLAARGTRRGADDVLAAAQRGAPREEIAHGDAISMVPICRGPTTTSSPSSPRSPTVVVASRYGTLVAAFGVAALVGVGMLAITAVFGSGGASSPEGAVRQLADAISHKDPLAAVDVLVPTEVRSMRQTVKDATQRAADLKIVDNASQPLAGVDLSVDNLQLSTADPRRRLRQGHDHGRRHLGEHAHGRDVEAVAERDHRTRANTQGKVDLARLAADSQPPDVRRDRSPRRRLVREPRVHRARVRARSRRRAAGRVRFRGCKAATLGSDTPENAVSDALHAWQAGNWDRLMALAPPDELPVYDYRAWIDQSRGRHPPRLHDRQAHHDRDGQRRHRHGEAPGVGHDRQRHEQGQVAGRRDLPDRDVGGALGLVTRYRSRAVDRVAECQADRSERRRFVLRSTQRLGHFDAASSACPATSGRRCRSGSFPFDSGTPTPASGVDLDRGRARGRSLVREPGHAPCSTRSTHAIQHVDQRTVYSAPRSGVPAPARRQHHARPAVLRAERDRLLSSSVFAFDGTQGQKVIGEIAAEELLRIRGVVHRRREGRRLRRLLAQELGLRVPDDASRDRQLSVGR